MERLTVRDKKGIAYFNDDGTLIRGANGTFHQKKDMTAQYIHDRFVALDKVIDRLAVYEDVLPLERTEELAQAEQDGRLVVLAVLPQGRPGGQKNAVYVIDDGEIYDDYVLGAHIGIVSNGELGCLYETYDGHDFYATDIDKTVFLIREEAEAALAERKERQK